MALAYLFDPNNQFQDRNGVNNVAGFLRVYYEGTDDRATTYKNFIGTMNPADIPIDNDGRAVVIVEDEKTYRLEVYARNGNLMWTQYPLCALVGGGGSFEQVQSNWDEEDPTSVAFIKNKPDLNNYLDKNGDGKDVTVTFDETSERTNIGTGEKLSVLFGKIKKWFTSLKAMAFKDNVDLTQDVNGVLPVSNGGTGGVNAGEARTNLDVYSKSETDTLLNGKIVITQTLPATGESGKIYYVGPSGSGPDLYEEYIWDDANDTWIKTGERSLDLSNYLQKNGDGKDVTVTFTEASTRTNIASTESLSTLFGKVKKFFTDLASVAFSGSYSDLSNTPSIPDDAGLVHKTGAETITGIKTFNNDVSPRQTGTIYSKQSKIFTCSVIKPYAEWIAAEQDDNHFRLWTIDITSIVTVSSTHCNIVVKLMGSWYSSQGNGALQKEITLQVYNGNIVFSKEDYVIAQSPCSDEFVISGVVKSGSSYLVQVINRNPTANNYPLRLEIEVFNKNDSILDNVTLTESITEGLPVWAAEIPQVTANGSPVITKATAVKEVFVATYNDTDYSDVEDAYFDNEQLVLCERGTYLYQLKRRYSNKFIFEGTVDKDDGTFETITLDSSNVWTIETHSVDEYCVYRKAYDNLHPLSTATTATDISNGYMDVEFDLGNADGFGVGEGHALVFIGIPNKGGPSGVDFADAFTKIELYAIDDDSSLQTPYLAAKVKDPSKDDYGDTLGPNDLYMWNRIYSGNRTSVINVKKFRVRYYLNMNTAWVPNLATNFYIYFTILL